MFAEQLQHIENRIQAACMRSGRLRESVRLVVVTKTIAPELINEVIGAGAVILGENRVQEYIRKRPFLLVHEFHMIGHLQKNKVKQIIDFTSLIHSVDTFELAQEIHVRALEAQRTMDVLIEVNVSGEESKYGMQPEEVGEMFSRCTSLSGIRTVGLMTVGEFVHDPEKVRGSFRRLRQLKDAMQLQHPDMPISELSMGMTNDFEVAIEEGATLIRIGTGIFGARA